MASKNRLLTTIAYQLDGKPTYALEGSIFIAGAVVQWLRDGLKIIREAAETQALAEAADPGQDVVIGAGLYRAWRALLGCRVPRRDLRADPQFGAGRIRPRGAGKRRLSDPRPAGGDAADWQGWRREATLRVDGGMTRQRLDDAVPGRHHRAPVDRPKVLETTALGAAWLAGMRAGVYPDRPVSPALGAGADVRASDGRGHARREIRGWKRAVAATLTF